MCCSSSSPNSCLLHPFSPPFRDQNFSFTRHFVASPATHFTKKREGHSAEMQKKHANTTVLQKQKRTICVFKCWLNCQLASFEALLSLVGQKKGRDAHPYGWVFLPERLFAKKSLLPKTSFVESSTVATLPFPLGSRLISGSCFIPHLSPREH